MTRCSSAKDSWLFSRVSLAKQYALLWLELLGAVLLFLIALRLLQISQNLQELRATTTKAGFDRLTFATSGQVLINEVLPFPKEGQQSFIELVRLQTLQQAVCSHSLV